MNRYLKILIVVLLLLVSVCLTFILTVNWVRDRYAQQLSSDAVDYKMESLYQIIDRYFIDDYDPQVLSEAAADGAAAGMVAATGDQWSYYISASEMAQYEEHMSNTYVGIGVMIREVSDGMEIMSVTPGGPAEEAGIQVGDVCTEVEGRKTSQLGMDETQNVVSGEEGTYVSMRFRRGEEEYTVSVERRPIVTDVATLQMLEDDIALIKITNFDLHCADQTLSCVAQAMEQGAKALLFDVRFNGGGMKAEMVRILDALLPEGEVFRSVDYRGVEEVDHSDAAFIDLPMAVLVNEDSISAAEFFAAVLQHYDAAEVVGTQTVGKGNFQYTFELGDGSAVSLSSGKYYTPAGESLTDVGVTPDVEVHLSYEDAVSLYYGVLEAQEDEQLQAAIELLK